MSEHISYTQINTYIQCPLKYKFQYIDKIEWPFVPSGLSFGVAIHKVAAYYYQKKMQGAELSPKKLSEVFEAWWKEENQNKKIQYKPSETFEKLLTKGIQLIQVLLSTQNGNQVVAVEKEFKTPLIHPQTKEQLSVPLVGFIDLIEKDCDGSFVIVDLKTAAKPYTDDKIVNDLQMTCYSYVADYYKLNQNKPVHLRFDVLLKNKDCEKLQYTVWRDEKDHQKLYQTAKSVLQAVEHGVFYPNPGFYCADCPFLQNCQNW
jgi:putative RecB family exonuclease